MCKKAKKSKRQPGRDELANAVPLIYREMAALFTWYVAWTRCHSAIVANNEDSSDMKNAKTLLRDAVVTGSIINVRKMAEFFKERPDDNSERDDDLRAYDFPNFTASGPTLLREHLTEIHKRVAHMTFRETQTDQPRPYFHFVKEQVHLTMPRCVAFLNYLEEDFFANEPEKQNEIRGVRATLTRLNSNWESLADCLGS